MKSRHKERINESIVSRKSYCQAGSDPIVEYDATGLKKVDNLVSSGANIANYHRRLRKGELLPFTPWHQVRERGTGSISYDLNYMSVVRCWANDTPGYHLTRLDVDEVERRIGEKVDPSFHVQRAAASAYEQGHDTLTFLAEVHKVVDMFRGAAKTLIGLKSRGGWGKAWLEYRYGWRILYYDLLDINKAINQLQEETRKRVKQRSGENISWVDVTDDILVDGGWYRVYGTFTDRYNVSVRGSVVADFEPPIFRFNPVLTAWELTTYSFILDWFVSIGQFLAAISFLTFSDQYYAAGGYLAKVNRTWTIRTEFEEGSSGSYDIAGDSSVQITSRIPTSVSTFPHVNIELDLSKILDLIAIVFSGPKKGTRV